MNQMCQVVVLVVQRFQFGVVALHGHRGRLVAQRHRVVLGLEGAEGLHQSREVGMVQELIQVLLYLPWNFWPLVGAQKETPKK